MMVRKLKFQKGIGLLELMLSLAIIAILLIMATRYYSITYGSQKVNEAVSQINSLQGALSNYKGDQADYSGLGTDPIGTLKDRGLLTPQSAAGTNPWGGGLTLTNNTTSVTIEMSGIPNSACNSLQDKFKDYGGACTLGGNQSNASTSGSFSLTVQ